MNTKSVVNSLLKMSKAIYLEVHVDIADDICHRLNDAITLIEELSKNQSSNTLFKFKKSESTSSNATDFLYIAMDDIQKIEIINDNYGNIRLCINGIRVDCDFRKFLDHFNVVDLTDG